MAQPSFYSQHTKIFWACKSLLAGRKISTGIEIRESQGWRLGAIVHRLRTEFGWPIEMERGAGRVAYYSLAADTDKSKLRLPPSAKALAASEVQQ
ncbi:hypothetical protein [Neptunicoccus sediminis]|uniref:hypothetical protein n=1 Tax=Neptunicoccus sediminis TaxID=1892596 RepID=UPI000845EFD1|nr:hypothetical protein [Neptunicoccus sediminis]